MARARSIKPGFFKNEQLAELPHPARLLFAGLWTIADRAGRLEDRPKRIKAEIFPYENQPVERLLESLNKAGFIIRYESGGNRFIAIPTWNKHQNPHVKEAASTIPAPCEHCADTGNSGTSPADSLNPEPLTLNPEPPIQGDPPSARSSNGTRDPALGQWTLDETYAPLVDLYRHSGKPVIDDDFADGWWPWKNLDIGQKQIRIDRMRANLESQLYDDPNFIPGVRKFIEREYKRELRAPVRRETMSDEVTRLVAARKMR